MSGACWAHGVNDLDKEVIGPHVHKAPEYILAGDQMIPISVYWWRIEWSQWSNITFDYH